MFLTGLVTGIVFTIVLFVIVLSRKMFVIKESKFGFDQTIEEIEASVKENQWSMPHLYDLQATMKKHGFDVKPVKVFSLCKPEHSYKILNTNEDRFASALMPCRVAVFEKEGKTFISMLNAGLFSKFMGNNIKTVMGMAGRENIQILAPVVK